MSRTPLRQFPLLCVHIWPSLTNSIKFWWFRWDFTNLKITWKTDHNMMISQKIDQFSWKSQIFVFRSFGCIWWHIGGNCCGIYTGATALSTIGMKTLWLYSLSFKWKMKTWFWDEFWKLINFLQNHHVGIGVSLILKKVNFYLNRQYFAKFVKNG